MGIRLPDLKNRCVLVVGVSMIKMMRASSPEVEKVRNILSKGLKLGKKKSKDEPIYGVAADAENEGVAFTLSRYNR